jgi:protein-tyrosine phosphatase
MDNQDFSNEVIKEIKKNQKFKEQIHLWQQKQHNFELTDLLELMDLIVPAKKINRTNFIKILKLKKIVYQISLIYNQIKNKIFKDHPWWSQITPNLYLGALPLEKHKKEILVLGIETVVSIVESFEKQKTVISKPISTEQWQEHNINNINISFPDFATVTTKKLYQSAQAIKNALDKDQLCYVHCKAGRGRSAAAIVSYLCLYENYTPEQGLNYVTKKRHFIDLKNKFAKIEILWHSKQAFSDDNNKEEHQKWLLEKIRSI